MKIFYLTAGLCLLLSGCAAYTSKLEQVHMQGLLARTLLHVMLNQCLLGAMACGDDWPQIREDAKEIYKTNCAKCTPKERYHVKLYRDATRKKFPETWKAIVDTLKS